MGCLSSLESLYDSPEANERYDAVFSLPAELQKRGVKIALSSLSDGPSADSRNLPYAAGYAVAYGLPYDEAMKAITINPAEMARRQPTNWARWMWAKVANVVIANGDPLDVRTSVQQVFIEGVAIPMTSRQTQLRGPVSATYPKRQSDSEQDIAALKIELSRREFVTLFYQDDNFGLGHPHLPPKI